MEGKQCKGSWGRGRELEPRATGRHAIPSQGIFWKPWYSVRKPRVDGLTEFAKDTPTGSSHLSLPFPHPHTQAEEPPWLRRAPPHP